MQASGTVLIFFPKSKEVSLPRESLKAASLQGGVLVPRPYWKLVGGVAALYCDLVWLVGLPVGVALPPTML